MNKTEKTITGKELIAFLEKEYNDFIWNNGVGELYKIYTEKISSDFSEITIITDSDCLIIIMGSLMSGKEIIINKIIDLNSIIKSYEFNIVSSLPKSIENEILEKIDFTNLWQYFMNDNCISGDYYVAGRYKNQMAKIYFNYNSCIMYLKPHYLVDKYSINDKSFINSFLNNKGIIYRMKIPINEVKQELLYNSSISFESYFYDYKDDNEIIEDEVLNDVEIKMQLLPEYVRNRIEEETRKKAEEKGIKKYIKRFIN